MNADYQDVKYNDLVKRLKGRIPVIPAKAGIQSRSERDFKPLRNAWTPVFTGVTTKRQFFHTFLLAKGGWGHLGTVALIVGLVFLLSAIWGCDYARMNDQESVRTYKKEIPEMPPETIPITGGIQIFSLYVLYSSEMTPIRHMRGP